MGKSVSEYIRRLRLERTASPLKLGKEQVAQIAFDAEYSGRKALTRAYQPLQRSDPPDGCQPGESDSHIGQLGQMFRLRLRPLAW